MCVQVVLAALRLLRQAVVACPAQLEVHLTALMPLLLTHAAAQGLVAALAWVAVMGECQ